MAEFMLGANQKIRVKFLDHFRPLIPPYRVRKLILSKMVLESRIALTSKSTENFITKI